MQSRHVGVVGVLAAAVVGWHCAAGSTLPTGYDSGSQQDAAGDVEQPQADAAAPGDGTSGDAPAPDDTLAPTDGQTPGDSSTPLDAGCAAQVTGDCDPVCQTCGAQKCSINPSTPTTASCQSNGVAGVNETCTGLAPPDVDNCQKGLICLSSDAKCHQFCRGDTDCTALNGACLFSIGGTPFHACKVPDACDPVANTGCTTGKGCFLWNNDTQTFCLTEGTGTDGTACPNGNECQGGYVCVGSTSYTCRAVCRVGGAACTNGAYACHTLTGFTNYGVCSP